MHFIERLLVGVATLALALALLVPVGTGRSVRGTTGPVAGTFLEVAQSHGQLTIVPDDIASASHLLDRTAKSTNALITQGAYSHNFSPVVSTFSQSDADGRWEGYLNFSDEWPMTWHYTLNMSSYAMMWADSNATQDADQYVNGRRNKSYRDHHVVPVSYGFHSTVPVNNGGVPYEIRFRATWHFTSPNASGTATLNATFRYRVTGSNAG